VLQAVSFLTTEPVDASGLKSDATRTVRLRLPQGLSATRESVTVRLKVIAAPGETTFSVAPQVTGLGDGLKSTLQTPSISVRVGGDQPTLRGLTASSIKASVSADGLTEGVHVLKPTVTVPEGLQIVNVDPPQVVLVLRR
jgi:YbbR domain-containing protein